MVSFTQSAPETKASQSEFKLSKLMASILLNPGALFIKEKKLKIVSKKNK